MTCLPKECHMPWTEAFPPSSTWSESTSERMIVESLELLDYLGVGAGMDICIPCTMPSPLSPLVITFYIAKPQCPPYGLNKVGIAGKVELERPFVSIG